MESANLTRVIANPGVMGVTMKKCFSQLLTVACFGIVAFSVQVGFTQVYYGVSPWYYGGSPYGIGYSYSMPYGGATVYSTNAQAYSYLLQSQAQSNRANAEAMLQYQQARGEYIKNQSALLDFYDQRARVAQQYQPIRSGADEASDRAAARERRERYRDADQRRTPETFTSAEYNSSTGELIFPSALKRPEFDEAREELQTLFGMRAAFGAATDRDRQIVDVSQQMLSTLKGMIGELPPADYLAARRFLEHARNVAMMTASS